MGLVLDVYSAASPNGTLLGTLTDAYAKSISMELNGTGAGAFTIPRSSAQATATIIAQGNIVKARLTELSASPIFSFFMEVGRFDLISPDEAGGEALTFGGRGSLSYLHRAILWSAAYVSGQPQPIAGEWLLYSGTGGSKAGAILRWVIDEAIAAGRPQQPFPSLSTDFTATLDSSGAVWATTSGTSEMRALVGDYLDDVVDRIVGASGGLVVEMDANLLLHAWNSHGVARTSATFATGKVRLQKAINIVTALSQDIGASRLHSHELVAGDPGYYGTASLGITPVREAFAQSAGVSATALAAIGTSLLNMSSGNANSIKLGVLYGNTPLSGLYLPGPVGLGGHYWLGDTITLHTGSAAFDYNESVQKVAGISIGEDEDGTPVVEVQLGSTYSSTQFSSIAETITEVRTSISDLTNEALRYAHSLKDVKVVSVLPTLPDPTFPIGSLVVLTTDGKVYRNVAGAWTATVPSTDITGTIADAQIAALAATKLTGQITGTQITDGSVSTPKLAAFAVTAGTIAAGAITSGKLAANSVVAGNIAALAVQAGDIEANAITTGTIAAGAVSAAAIAAGAIDATKIAAGAVSTDALLVGRDSGLIDNPSFEIGAVGVASTVPGWTAVAASPGYAEIRAASAAVTGTQYVYLECGTGTTGSHVDSAIFGVATGDAVIVSAWRGSVIDTPAASVQIRWFDAAGALITTSTVQTVTSGTVAWTRIGGNAIAPALAVTAQIRLLNGTLSSAVKFDDVRVFRAGPYVNPPAQVVIDQIGITVTNGAIKVTNAGSTVIIDGTSDIFKISATGTLTNTGPADAVTFATVTLSALGTPTTTPAHICYIAPTSAPVTTTSMSVNPSLQATVMDSSWVAATSGGSPTVRAGAITVYAQVVTYLDVSGQVVVRLEVSNYYTSAQPRWCRYYVLQEAAL